MTDDIAQRLRALEAEYEAGQKMIADLDARRSAVTTTLLRIEGAIHVLRELCVAPSAAAPAAALTAVAAVAAATDAPVRIR